MAKKKHKKHKPALRNAAPPRPSGPPRAAPRPRPSGGGHGGSVGGDSAAWNTIKTAGGAAGAALACAFIARKDWLPPKVITGAVSAVGAALSVGGHSDTLRALGSGAMSAAGAQLSLMMIDDHYHGNPPVILQPTKKPANADSLPAGALESAYERARARLAMTQTAEAA